MPSVVAPHGQEVSEELVRETPGERKSSVEGNYLCSAIIRPWLLQLIITLFALFIYLQLYNCDISNCYITVWLIYNSYFISISFLLNVDITHTLYCYNSNVTVYNSLKFICIITQPYLDKTHSLYKYNAHLIWILLSYCLLGIKTSKEMLNPTSQERNEVCNSTNYVHFR